VTVNLNGFTIRGSGGSSGVFNVGFDDVTIKNGAITGFQDGVRADEVTDLVIKDVTFSGQILSSIVVINSADVRIKRVFISQPPGDGVNPAEAIRLANVDGAKVKNATVKGGYFGVLSLGDPNLGDPGTATELVVRNSVFTNTTHGIFLERTTDSKIVGNRVDDNGGIGIGLVNGSIGNKIKLNIVTGNDDVDLFHDEGSSPNRWINNTCGTSGGVDIDCP
jgi:parallel beta-helix repeat protein